VLFDEVAPKASFRMAEKGLLDKWNSHYIDFYSQWKEAGWQAI
jgi:hypothetical protein